VIDDWFGAVNEVRIRVGSIELINIKHWCGVDKEGEIIPVILQLEED
jgi:hypothetical protein